MAVRTRFLVPAALTVVLCATPPAQAQTAPPPVKPPVGPVQGQKGDATARPAQGGGDDVQVASDEKLGRIREALEQRLENQPKIDLTQGRMRIYVSVVAPQPSIEKIIGSYDLVNGPTKRGNPMTHQEYLNMVTPKELYGSAGISAAEVLQFSLVNWLAQSIIRKGIEELRDARTEAERERIRERIDRELAALRGGR